MKVARRKICGGVNRQAANRTLTNEQQCNPENSIKENSETNGAGLKTSSNQEQ